MRRWARQFVCRHAVHDWWALAYPPARRWECHRCGVIMEEAARTDLYRAEPATPHEHDTSRAKKARPSR